MIHSRNAPCWCGSGKKFKRCHLGREKLPPLTTQDLLGRQRTAANLRRCLVADLESDSCSGPIVQAHSLSRKASLEQIAHKQHVYGFRGSFIDLKKGDGVDHPRLVGVREASTFTGFCEGHDGRLFKPIDACQLVPTPEQLGLLAYRALCRELFTKSVLGRTVATLHDADQGLPEFEQLIAQYNTNQFETHVAEAVPHLQRQQHLWHEMVRHKSYERLSYALIHFSVPPYVQCAGVSQPDKDFLGRTLLDLKKPGTRQDDVAFVMVPGQTGGFGAFAWLDTFQEAETFVGSLLGLPTERIAQQLVRYAFETFDNVWLSPRWWDAMPSQAREFLITRMNVGGLPHPAWMPDPYDLRDNGMSFVDWRITDIETKFA